MCETLQMLNVCRPAAHFSLSLLTKRYPLTLKPARAGELEIEELSPGDPQTASRCQSCVYRESHSLCHKDEASIIQLKDAETHWKESSLSGENIIPPFHGLIM